VAPVAIIRLQSCLRKFEELRMRWPLWSVRIGELSRECLRIREVILAIAILIRVRNK
jgi:hypothetical protein